jgi:hypothetical protein
MLRFCEDEKIIGTNTYINFVDVDSGGSIRDGTSTRQKQFAQLGERNEDVSARSVYTDPLVLQ